MIEIFKILEVPAEGERDQKAIALGIDLKVAGKEVLCPISGVCGSYEDFNAEISAIRKDLESLLTKAKGFFAASLRTDGELSADMSPEKAWSILSQIKEEDHFIRSFNGLDENKRREVADYVLTHCNVFSGKGSAFSARYSNVSGLLE